MNLLVLGLIFKILMNEKRYVKVKGDEFIGYLL